jgi:hypothetical protein
LDRQSHRFLVLKPSVSFQSCLAPVHVEQCKGRIEITDRVVGIDRDRLFRFFDGSVVPPLSGEVMPDKNQ